MPLLILHFFFGMVGYWMMYGTAIAGNEFMFTMLILGGFISFWAILFIKAWLYALVLIIAVLAISYFIHWNERRKYNRARKNFRNV